MDNKTFLGLCNGELGYIDTDNQITYFQNEEDLKYYQYYINDSNKYEKVSDNRISIE